MSNDPDTDQVSITMGLIDSVSTGRMQMWIPPFPATKVYDPNDKPGSLAYGISYYQTLGCAKCILILPGGAFVGQSLPGIGHDIEKSVGLTKDWAHITIAKKYAALMASWIFNK